MNVQIASISGPFATFRPGKGRRDRIATQQMVQILRNERRDREDSLIDRINRLLNSATPIWAGRNEMRKWRCSRPILRCWCQARKWKLQNCVRICGRRSGICCATDQRWVIVVGPVWQDSMTLANWLNGSKRMNRLGWPVRNPVPLWPLELVAELGTGWRRGKRRFSVQNRGWNRGKGPKGNFDHPIGRGRVVRPQ